MILLNRKVHRGQVSGLFIFFGTTRNKKLTKYSFVLNMRGGGGTGLFCQFWGKLQPLKFPKNLRTPLSFMNFSSSITWPSPPMHYFIRTLSSAKRYLILCGSVEYFHIFFSFVLFFTSESQVCIPLYPEGRP